MKEGSFLQASAGQTAWAMPQREVDVLFLMMGSKLKVGGVFALPHLSMLLKVL